MDHAKFVGHRNALAILFAQENFGGTPSIFAQAIASISDIKYLSTLH
jgi:hypothetical protein